MSEYINNVSRRKAIIKNILKKLHDGEDPEILKTEFAVLAGSASSQEIAEAEQELISEGVPVEAIQSLCDLHVAVFKSGLDEVQDVPQAGGHPLKAYQENNTRIEGLLAKADLLMKKASGTAQNEYWQAFWAVVEDLKLVDTHYILKENQLFAYLEKRGFGGPSKVMWGVHNDIRAVYKQLVTLQDSGSAVNSAKISAAYEKFAADVRSMIYKENKILFPAAVEHLTAEDWNAMKGEKVEMSYSAEENKTDVINPQGAMPLSTGALTLEQINLTLTHLPVDVTFVDENDEVRFYTQGKERIFVRTPAIIGRKVQNCHPPQSVDKVVEIVDAFKSGERDDAEFWIQMGEKFVHIRYFALRDAKGTYKGTIEVTQDVASIRALEGEKRLLNEPPVK